MILCFPPILSDINKNVLKKDYAQDRGASSKGGSGASLVPRSPPLAGTRCGSPGGVSSHWDRVATAPAPCAPGVGAAAPVRPAQGSGSCPALGTLPGPQKAAG